MYGVTNATGGIRRSTIKTSIAPNRQRFGNLHRAIAYAAGTPNAVAMNADAVAITIEFHIASPRRGRRTRFSQCRSVGSYWTNGIQLLPNSAGRSLREVITAQ